MQQAVISLLVSTFLSLLLAAYFFKIVGSEFIITGKGGFPANPHETLNSDEVRVGLVEPVEVEKRGDEETGRQGGENHNSTASKQLVPA